MRDCYGKEPGRVLKIKDLGLSRQFSCLAVRHGRMTDSDHYSRKNHFAHFDLGCGTSLDHKGANS